ncbi:MAG: phosphoribosylamine--glycine ligase [Methylococcales bacterium]
MTAKVVVIGKDARTAQIVRRLRASGARVYVISDVDNPIFLHESEKFYPAQTDNVPVIVSIAGDIRPDLVVIGPEEPLYAGVVDEIQRQLGTPCFGPPKALARIEWSKSFARSLLSKYDIPGNLEYKVFTSTNGMEAYLRYLGDFVVKADGLMGGKGVKVFGDQLASTDEALRFAGQILRHGPVVIEERVEGEEFSLQSFSDGDSLLDAIPVQDHKRAFDGDRGPNTGGMGSYSCADHSLPFLDSSQLLAASKINAAVTRALREETGIPYRGVLYGGFMATADGVRVLEFNARFGDPEAMNVLAVLDGDFLALCQNTANGSLKDSNISFRKKATVCKYLVPEGYPDNPVRGARIRGVPESSDDVDVVFAAIRESVDSLNLTGSRAVAFVGVADSVGKAGELVEEAIRKVEGPVFHRWDIGTEALLAKRVEHMHQLRAAPAGGRKVG